jgi:hypothetical protein
MTEAETEELRQALCAYLVVAQPHELTDIARLIFTKQINHENPLPGPVPAPPAPTVELLEAICRELVAVENILHWTVNHPKRELNRPEIADLRKHRLKCEVLRNLLMLHVRPVWAFGQEGGM